MKMPLAVRIVEALGWLYAILAVSFMGASLFYYLSKGDFPEAAMSGVSFFCLLAFPAAMVLALRQGRRAWFVWTHTLIVLVVLMVAVAMTAAVAAIAALILLVSPIVLLFRPEASRWFHEMSICRKPDRFGGCAVAMLCVLLVLVGCVMYMSHSVESGFADVSAMAHRGHVLYGEVIKTGMCRDAGEAYVDPTAYTNSTDFIMALSRPIEGVSSNLGRYTNIWCVVVNPPDDDMFPVLFTANMNPSDLFQKEGGHRCISLTCPKKWGGECFDFCEKAAVVIRKGGAVQIVKGKYYGGMIPFPEERRAQLEATYILTPTGRVSFAALLPHGPSQVGRQ